MINKLLQFDTAIFNSINQGASNPALDKIMAFVTHPNHFIIPALMILALIFYKRRLRGFDILITVGITILISDQLSSHVLKPLIARARPCLDVATVKIVLGECNSSFSFPSSHATNIMAAATIFLTWFKKPSYLVSALFVVLIISFSRIYLGIHYPSDILAGWVLGFSCSQFVRFIRKKFFKTFIPSS